MVGFLQQHMFKTFCSNLLYAVFVLLPLKMPNGFKLKIVQGRLSIPLRDLLSPFCHLKVLCVFMQYSSIWRTVRVYRLFTKILSVKQDCMYSVQ